MIDYRCYGLDSAGHIHDVTVIATDCDEHARERGAELLDHSYHAGVEIWAGARRIERITKPACAARRSDALGADGARSAR